MRLLSICLLSIVVFLDAGLCSALEEEPKEIKYTSIFGDEVVFSQNNTLFGRNDAFTKIKACKLSEYCIQIAETLIVLPPKSVFVKSKKERFSLYQISPSIELQIEYKTLSIFDEPKDGFVVQTFETKNDRPGPPIGIYFFSFETGVISFDYRFTSMNTTSGDFELSTESLIISGEYGIFRMSNE